MRRPTKDFQLDNFPTQKEFVATLAKFEKAREERHRLAAEYLYRCESCNKGYKKYSALEKHAGSRACTAAVQGGKWEYSTPDGK